jgi:RNase H-fold protein (predicted Holliday junction resolvase)
VSRVVGIDYGMKRCGIAATDVLNIAVHGVGTVEK